MKKDTRLGTDPLSWIKDSRKDETRPRDEKVTIKGKKYPLTWRKNSKGDKWLPALPLGVGMTPEGKEVLREKGGVTPVKQDDSKPAYQQASKTARQQNSKPAGDTIKIKATYYLPPEIVKGLKMLGILKGKDLSNLVREAIEDLLKKYKQ